MMMNVEQCKNVFYGVEIDPVTQMRPKDAQLYEKLKATMPVELKVLSPPIRSTKRYERRKYRRLIVYLHKLVIVEGWWKV